MSIAVGIRVGPAVGVRAGVNPAINRAVAYSLQKTGGVNGTYDAQAYTAETFAGTVYVDYTIVDATDQFIVGLSADNPDANYTGIDRGPLFDGGTVWKSENGVLTNIGAAVANDVLRVERVAGTNAVNYYKQTGGIGAFALLATGTALAGSLIVDSSFRLSGDACAVAIVAGGLYQRVTWNVVNVTATEL